MVPSLIFDFRLFIRLRRAETGSVQDHGRNRYDAGGLHPSLVRKYSAITYLKTNGAKIPPMFVARAGLDQIPTMNDSIDRFVKEAIDNNICLDFANHPTGVHGFDNQNDDARSREIIQKVIAFLKEHLGN